MTTLQIYAAIFCSTGWVVALFWSVQMYKDALHSQAEMRGLSLGLQRFDPLGFFDCFSAFEERIIKSKTLNSFWDHVKIHLIVPSRYATSPIVRSTRPLTELLSNPQSVPVQEVLVHLDRFFNRIALAISTSMILPFALLSTAFYNLQGPPSWFQNWMTLPFIGSGLATVIYTSLRYSARKSIQRDLKALAEALGKVMPYISVQQTSLLLLQETRESIQLLQNLSNPTTPYLSNRIPERNLTSPTPSAQPMRRDRSTLLGGQRLDTSDFKQQFKNLQSALSYPTGEWRRND